MNKSRMTDWNQDDPAFDQDWDDDQLGAARGVMYGLIIGSVLWTVFIAAVVGFWVLHYFNGV